MNNQQPPSTNLTQKELNQILPDLRKLLGNLCGENELSFDGEINEISVKGEFQSLYAWKLISMEILSWFRRDYDMMYFPTVVTRNGFDLEYLGQY